MKLHSYTFLLALAALTSATPSPVPQDTSEPAIIGSPNFSFASWVDSILANPDTALTPEQALAAANASAVPSRRNIGPAHEARQSRITCRPEYGTRANANQAVHCINELARRKKKCAITCITKEYCKRSDCHIAAGMGGGFPCPNKKIDCNALARTAGAVMDKCYRADDTVKGDGFAPRPNGDVFVLMEGKDRCLDGGA